LKNLNSSDKHWIHPFGLHSDGYEEVVAIHEGVHSVVHGTEEDTASGESDVWMLAEEQYGHVIIPV